MSTVGDTLNLECTDHEQLSIFELGVLFIF